METDLALLPDEDGTIPLFWPNITESMRVAVWEQMGTRWLGQGPAVEQFEREFCDQILGGQGGAIAVNSGTSALHLAYLLALESYWPQGREALDGEIICPVFTCTATNLPILYLGGNLKIRWADIDPLSMNPSVESIASLINAQTRAIVIVHYGGYPVDMELIRSLANSRGIPVIEDAAQALGSRVDNRPVGASSPYGAFSFQAIKHITTGDGGLLSVSSPEEFEVARRLRWFGIDRAGKQNGTWENDIRELGYKYQMTDIAARMGLAGLADFETVLLHRQTLLERYESNLKNCSDVQLLTVPDALKDRLTHSAWLATIIVDEGRDRLREHLRDQKIESNAVHFRNDRYTTFSAFGMADAPTMDAYEEKYLCLPLHTNMGVDEVDRVSEAVTAAF